MKIQFSNNINPINNKLPPKNKQNIRGEISNNIKKIPSKVKTSALVALFLLPTLGVVKTCTNQDKNMQSVYSQIDFSQRDKYLKVGERTFYLVQKGDNIEKIAREFGISSRRLLAENGLEKSSVIYPNDTLLIPESYTVEKVKDLEDVSKVTSLSEEFLKDLCEMESVNDKIYKDRNGNKTIGVGHLVKSYELEKYEDKKLSKKEIYTLLAQDLINTEMDLKTVIPAETFDKLPVKIRESVLDLVFNKGVAAVTSNKKLFNAINDGDYVGIITNLTQDYSVITNAKGTTIQKPASGLSKRRLYDMKNAAAVFEGEIPKEVVFSAKKVYENGLKYMANEKEKGEISSNAYENVLAEYKNLAYEWFDGKIGESSSTTSEKANVSDTTSGSYINIRVDGQKTQWTQSSLYADWQKTADRQLRYVKRPLPEIDSKGNIIALVKTINPTQKGVLSGKTIIVNPGHGGAMNYKGKNGKVNVNFDPGTSNAVMSKKNPNVETNTFIGNGGKSLEEWVVNERIANELVKKITAEGGKVIYVQGSVYSVMDAIRDIQEKQKIAMIVSLHSNSTGGKRGIHVYANKRGGVDKQDEQLASVIVDNLNEHDWFRGITSQKSKSLGVLSSSENKTSSVPGVLIETGDLKNEDDVANLNSRDFKNQMVESILGGIKDYLNN